MSDFPVVNCRTRIRQDVITNVKRSFSQGKGTLTVKVGEEVSPTDILGEGAEVAGFRNLALASELNVVPSQVNKYLNCRVGQTVFRGELLASKNELFGLKKKLFLAPTDGIVDSFDERSGILRLRVLPKSVKLISGVYGIIDQIFPTMGTVSIRTKVDLVYGILGSGRERSGILRILNVPDTLVGNRQILPGFRGDILVGGAQVSLDALETAVSFQVEGIISGGMNLADFNKVAGSDWGSNDKRWGDVGISLLLTEGFGAVPIGHDIFSCLQKYEQKFAILDGNRGLLVLPSDDPKSMIDIRKEKPITTVGGSPDLGGLQLQVGMTVRIVAPPFFGRQGKVEAIDRTKTILPSGVSTYLVTVAGQGKVRVPYLNLEILQDG